LQERHAANFDKGHDRHQLRVTPCAFDACIHDFAEDGIAEAKTSEQNNVE
jgi:hypothetical protein